MTVSRSQYIHSLGTKNKCQINLPEKCLTKQTEALIVKFWPRLPPEVRGPSEAPVFALTSVAIRTDCLSAAAAKMTAGVR